MSNKNSDLVSEKHALSKFFTSLLTDTNDKTNTVVEYEVADDVDTTVFLPDIPKDSPGIAKPLDEPVSSDVVINNKGLESDLKSSTEILSVDAKPLVIEEPFQIMMFKTAGLTLAVPLVELSGVISWPENITEMPGHKESYLGLVQHQDKKIPIIDIAKIVFPQDRLKSVIDTEQQERLHRIVFINDFKWGLACDVVNDVITIEPEQIKWRNPGSTRAWLAGTVVEYMCALLNTKELSKLLNSDYGSEA